MGREEECSRGRTEGRQRSRSKEPTFLGEVQNKRTIEELEEELKLLKEGDKKKDEKHRQRRTGTTQVRAKTCTASPATRSTVEYRTASTARPCALSDIGSTTLECLPLGTSATRYGDSSNRSPSPLFGKNRTSETPNQVHFAQPHYLQWVK